MITRRSLLGSAAAGAAFTLLPDRAGAAPAIGRTLATGLVVPWGLAFLPSGDALVTTRESGDVVRVRRTGGRVDVGRIAAARGSERGEGGLLGVAVSPRFAQNRWVYFYLTTATDNRVIRMRYAAGQLGDKQVVLSGIPRGSTHNGGRIKFGPDGKLYVGTGDVRADQPGQQQGSVSQDPGSLAGKILRVNRDGTVPAGNPFGAGNPVWTKGHRNVQGLAWDGQGRMWATEFGELDRDELNQVVAGEDYGWPAVEGGDGPGPFADPFVVWDPTETCSPSGLTVRGNRAWVAALRGRSLYSVVLSGPNARRVTRYFNGELGRIRTVELAPDGSLWLMTSNRDGRGTPGPGDDKVVRVTL